MERDALDAALVAFPAEALLTPVWRARSPGRGLDELEPRGLASEATPLLGGLAIFAAR